ncbi:MAG: hypothetical protein RLZZ292_2548 [Bacteroidota bacterium]|jgi:hypothetical protein
MSGVKKTPLEICQDDVRNLRGDLAATRQQAQRDVQNAITQSQRQHQAALQQAQNDAQQRESRLQGQIGNLNNEITRNWQQQRQVMATQRQEFHAQLQDQSTAFHQELHQNQEEVTQRMAAQSLAFRGELDAESTRLRNEMNENQRRVYDEIRKQEANVNRKITDLRQEALHAINDLAKYTEKALKAQDAKFTKITQAQQKEMNAARTDLNNILNREQNADKKAKMLSDALDTMISAFEKDDWFQKFRKRELAMIKDQVQQTKQSGNHAYSNVAILQNQLFALQTMEADVEIEARRFEALHSLVLASANALLNTMKANRENTYFLDADGAKSAKVEVDFWTYGAYGKLNQEAAGIQRQLETNKLNAHLDQTVLKEWLKRLNDIDKLQSDLMNLAIQRGNTSHIRAEMADMIVGALEQQAFEVVRDKDGEWARNYMGSAHQEKDQRAGYYLLMRNSTGTEISIVIEPDENLIKNELIMNTKNSQYFDEKAACQRVEDLNETLREAGLEVGKMTAPQHGHVEALYDANALKKKGLDAKSKKQLKL